MGDSILNYVVGECLYLKYKNDDEGLLTKKRAELVSYKPLAKVVEKLGLFEEMLLGNGETGKGKHESIKADLYEAILCAIYLDGGMKSAKEFVTLTLLSAFEGKGEKEKSITEDFKSRLYEYCTKERLGKIEFNLLSKSGQDHCPIFEMELKISDKSFGKEKGSSKKEVEQKLSKKALDKLKRRKKIG